MPGRRSRMMQYNYSNRGGAEVTIASSKTDYEASKSSVLLRGA